MAIVVRLDEQLHARRMTLTQLAERIDMLANLSILKTGTARAIRFSTLEARRSGANPAPCSRSIRRSMPTSSGKGVGDFFSGNWRKLPLTPFLDKTPFLHTFSAFPRCGPVSFQAHVPSGPDAQSVSAHDAQCTAPIRKSTMKRIVQLLVAFAASTGTASATWSVAAVNPGTIAVAGASCSYMVYGIASVVPGKGVVIVQAASNAQARKDATAMLVAGAPLDDIIAKLTDPASGYEPAQQQYALLGVGKDARPRVYTGAEVEDTKGSAVSDHVSVQANTMVSDAVVRNTYAAPGKAKWSSDTAMASAVMRAMDAGASAGGDKRCGRVDSASAYIGLYKKDDPPGQPWLELYGIEPGTASAMAHLDGLFTTWLGGAMRDRSTRLFVVPSAGSKREAEKSPL